MKVALWGRPQAEKMIRQWGMLLTTGLFFALGSQFVGNHVTYSHLSSANLLWQIFIAYTILSTFTVRQNNKVRIRCEQDASGNKKWAAKQIQTKSFQHFFFLLISQKNCARPSTDLLKHHWWIVRIFVHVESFQQYSRFSTCTPAQNLCFLKMWHPLVHYYKRN